VEINPTPTRCRITETFVRGLHSQEYEELDFISRCSRYESNSEEEFMMSYKCATAILAVLVSTGCAVRQPAASFKASGFRTVVRANCLTAPLVLQGCDGSTEPTHCRLVTIKYRPGCAEIQLKHPEGLAPK
jgi:hypothetical protein